MEQNLETNQAPLLEKPTNYQSTHIENEASNLLDNYSGLPPPIPIDITGESPTSEEEDNEKHLYDLPDMEHTTKGVIIKLFCASGMCFVLMLVEAAGGIVAHSLAILTDAAHMFSDISGFFISIFSIWLAKRPSTKKLSYGYHRAEVVGALASVLLIWGITIWLVAEAVNRVINPDYEIEGWIMLGTAIFGLCCNLLLGKILHSGGHHHHHGHDHGHDHGHEHGHDEHGHDEHGHDEHGHDEHEHGHDEHEHGHDHKEKNDKKKVDHEHEHDEHEHEEHDHEHEHEEHDHKHEEHEHKKKDKKEKKHDHDHKEHKEKKEKKEKKEEIHEESHEDSHSHSHDDHEKKPEQKIEGFLIELPSHNNFNKAGYQINLDKPEASHSHDHEEIEDAENPETTKKFKTGAKNNKNLSVIAEKDNYNLRAAMIHIIGNKSLLILKEFSYKRRYRTKHWRCDRSLDNIFLPRSENRRSDLHLYLRNPSDFYHDSGTKGLHDGYNGRNACGDHYS